MTVDLTKLVKPLVWDVHENEQFRVEIVITILGRYKAQQSKGLDYAVLCDPRGRLTRHETIEAAKAAAQADYATHIAAALDGDAVAAMIAEAVRAEREAMVEVFHQDFIWAALASLHTARVSAKGVGDECK